VTQRALNVSVIWMLNLLTDTLASQLAMLRHASALGLPVNFVELGNEFYLGKADYLAAFPSGAAYGSVAAAWIAALRAAFPHAAVGVVSDPPPGSGGGGSPRGLTWDAQVFAALQSGPGALRAGDGATIHVYTPSGATANRDSFSLADVPQVLAQPFVLARAVAEAAARKVKSLPPCVNTWFTEYNLLFFGRNGSLPPADVPMWGTWADALVLATTTLQLLPTVPSAALLTHHELVGPASSGDFFASADAFAFPGSPDKKLPTALLGASGAGAAFALLGAATRGCTSTAAVDLPSAPPLLPPPAAPAPSAFGAVFYSDAAGITPGAVALNLGALPLGLELWRLGDAAGFNVTWNTYQQLSAQDARVAVNDVAVLSNAAGSVGGKAVLAMPPYSITQLSGSVA